MNKIEFLSASLPYGLKVKLKNSYRKEEILPPIYDNFKLYMLGRGETRLFVPIIRHLDTLTQECVQADYNDGKPFIPIVKLGWTYKEFVHQWSASNTEASLAFLSFDDAMQMIKWHFWPNMSEIEDVVYVTDKFNPYK